jgi:hypothetical protein
MPPHDPQGLSRPNFDLFPFKSTHLRDHRLSLRNGVDYDQVPAAAAQPVEKFECSDVPVGNRAVQ